MSDDSIGNTAFGLQVGIGFVGKVITAVAGFVGSVVLARALGPGDYGLFYIALSIAQFLENPLSGWAEACRKRMTQTDFDSGEAIGSVFLAVSVTALVLAPLSAGILSVLTSNPVIPTAVPILFVSMATYWSLVKILSGRPNFSMSAWAGAFSTVTKISLMISFVVLGFGVWGMVVGTALGTLLIVPVVIYWIGIWPSIPSVNSIRSIGKFARWSIPRGFVGTALERMDIILLGWLVSAGIAGKYQVALQISMPAVFLSSVIGNGLVGRISNRVSRDEDWQLDLRNSLSYASILAVPICFGSVVVGEALVTTVFGNKFAGGGVFLIGLATYRLLKTQTSPWEAAISGLDYPRLSFFITFGIFVTNLILGIGLWYVYSAVGIMAATVIAAAMGYLLRVYMVRRMLGVKFTFPRPVLKQVGAATVMTSVLVPIKISTRGADNSLYLGPLLVVGGIVYVGVLLFISRELRQTVYGILYDFYKEYDPSDS